MRKTVQFATNLIFATLFSATLCSAAVPIAPPPTPAVVKKSEAVLLTTPVVELLDINTATEAQLRKIDGIGDDYAKKIIAGRPYVKKDQLVSRKILPVVVYDRIKNKIIAKRVRTEEKKSL